MLCLEKYRNNKHQDSQRYRRPAKQPVARPDESVRQPDVHSGGDGDKQDVVLDCGHFVDMISEFEEIRRNYTDSREQQD